MSKILKEINENDIKINEIAKKNINEAQTKTDSVKQPESQTKPESTPQQPKTLQDWIELRNKINEELKAFINNRKAVMKWDEAREYRKKVIEIRSRVGVCERKIYELKRAKKNQENKAKPTKIALHQGNFLGLLKVGYSITKITESSDGVKKSELKNIMTQSFLEDCERARPGFIAMWERWQKKFLSE